MGKVCIACGNAPMPTEDALKVPMPPEEEVCENCGEKGTMEDTEDSAEEESE